MRTEEEEMRRTLLQRIILVWGIVIGSTGEKTLGGEPGRFESAVDARERCLEILQGGLKSEEFWPSMHAAEALTLAGQGQDVVTALQPRLPQETDHQRRCGLARELVRAGDRAPVNVLFEILANEQSNGRVHAAESLYKLGEVADGRLLLQAFQQRQQSQLQLMAAAALAKQGRADALQFLRERLQSEERAVRNTAAWALARLGTPVDLPLLKQALEQETDAFARGMLVIALASLGDADGRVQLGRQLDSPDPGVRALSAECAGYCRCSELEAKLTSMLDDTVLDVRLRAAQSLLVMSQPPVRDQKQ